MGSTQVLVVVSARNPRSAKRRTRRFFKWIITQSNEFIDAGHLVGEPREIHDINPIFAQWEIECKLRVKALQEIVKKLQDNKYYPLNYWKWDEGGEGSFLQVGQPLPCCSTKLYWAVRIDEEKAHQEEDQCVSESPQRWERGYWNEIPNILCFFDYWEMLFRVKRGQLYGTVCRLHI